MRQFARDITVLTTLNWFSTDITRLGYTISQCLCRFSFDSPNSELLIHHSECYIHSCIYHFSNLALQFTAGLVSLTGSTTLVLLRDYDSLTLGTSHPSPVALNTNIAFNSFLFSFDFTFTVVTLISYITYS